MDRRHRYKTKQTLCHWRVNDRSHCAPGEMRAASFDITVYEVIHFREKKNKSSLVISATAVYGDVSGGGAHLWEIY